MGKKRVLATLLALMMVVGLLPTGAFAAHIDRAELPLEAPAEAADAALPVQTAEETPDAQPETGSPYGSVQGAAYSDDPDAYEIYPVPHSVVYPAGEAAFTMTEAVNVVVDREVDRYTTDFLRELLERFGHTMDVTAAVDPAKTNIVLAIHGDNDTVDSATNVFDGATPATGKFDPYLLKAEAGTGGNGLITIIGEDTDCVYYGVATLQMMFTSFNGEKFLPVQIEDYSNVALRGFIEGFYGGFDYKGRESQIRSIRDVKGNMYVFASKTDEYHGGSKWNQTYPADELAQIKHLVDVGKAMKVEYTWSFHMGKAGLLNGVNATTDDLYTERLDIVKAKFQQLYDIGVRSFHILNDDYNTGTNALQVEFLNDINAWLRAKGDCRPLVYCCENYCRYWWKGGAEAELTALRALDNDIYLYWTGEQVNFPMTQASITWPYEIAQHQIVTWLNYPCSEHDKAGVYLGNLKHYVDDPSGSSDGLQHQYGFMSNPIGLPEANKVAYFQLLSWCWNRDHYTTYMDEIWKDTFKYLQPEVWESYYTIAQNTSNCPDSGRYPGTGFPESEHLIEMLATVRAAILAGESPLNSPEAQDLLAEFDKIVAAVANFRANCENKTLVAELEPHLKSLESVAVAGKQAILAAAALAAQNVNAAWTAFSEGAVALSKWDANKPFITANGYQDHQAKAGSKRLQPFASAALDYVKTQMVDAFTPGGLSSETVPMIKLGGQVKANDANAQKILDGDLTTYASYGVDHRVGDYFGVDLGAVKLVTGVDVLQGQNDTHHDYFHKATLEYSADGEHWSTLVTKINSHHIAVEDLNVAARYVRLRLLETGYGNKENFYTYIREFTVTEKAPSLLYTNVDAATGVTAAADAGVYTLTVPSLTLGAEEYVGIRLPEIAGIVSIATQGTLPDGVKLQRSVSGVVWTDGAPSQATRVGYVRLYNSGDAAAALTNVTVTASEPARTQLSVAASNPAGDWSNVIDGNRTTYKHTQVKQEYGQYVILDLGGVQPVRDVTLVVPQGDGSYMENPLDIPHNLDFFVGNSADPDGTWEKIGELRSKNAAGENTPPAGRDDITDPSYRIDPGNRVFQVNGEGRVGRYLKIAFADVTSFRYYYINEIEVNKTVTQAERLTAVEATSGTAANADDDSLLTFLTPEKGQEGSWTKHLQAPAAFDSVTVLRGADGDTATVHVQKNEADWTDVGTLTGTATTLPLASQGPITAVKVSWGADDVPDIAEVVLAEEVSGTAPTLYPNIYEQPASPEQVTVANGTAADNLPLPDHVSVTTSTGATTELPVTWSCETYVPTTAGTYTFVGAFDLDDQLITNPGGFTFNVNVAVRPAETGGSGEPENLALNKPVYVSGVEVAGDSTPPAKAVDGQGGENSRWSGNYMKGNNNGATNGSNPSWIVVDLGGNVTSVTNIAMEYYKKVWPEAYVVQVAGSDYTPKDFSSNVGTVAATHEAFTGQHAQDASCWKTVKTFTGQALQDYPTNTVSTAELKAVTGLPSPIRYLRLYFTRMNNSAGGNSIGLTELTVTGTRAAAATPNIESISAVTAAGVVGDAWDVLGVPTHVIATLSDTTTVRLPVTWDNTGYDATSTTAQTFNGRVNIPAGVNVTNTGNVVPRLTVTLSQPPEVAGYSITPDRVTVPHRTAFADLALPTQAVVQFQNGATRELTITWDETSYNADKLEEQDVEGTVTLPWGGNKTHDVTILVHHTPVPATSIAISAPADAPEALYANESLTDQHTLQLTAVIDDAASIRTAVWSSDAPRVAMVDSNGLVTAMGPGTATITAATRDGSRLSASYEVTVKWQLEGKVTVSGGSKVGATLSANLNSFVQDAKKSIDIQWWRKGKTDTDFVQITGATTKDCAVALAVENVGAQYKVVITGQGLYEGTSASDPITITKLDGPALKADPTANKVSTAGATDGAITGLFKGRAYQYQKVAELDQTPSAPVEDNWENFLDRSGDETGSTDSHGTASISSLGAGTYVVRRAADDLHEAGPYRTVTIDVVGSEKHHVTNPNRTDGNVVQVGRTEIAAGDTVTLTVTPKEGWELVPGSLKATEDADNTKFHVATGPNAEGKYTFTMPAAAVTISAQFRLKTYQITHDLHNITCDMAQHNHTATHGEAFSIVLAPVEGYEMTPNTITVTDSNDQPFTDYTYLPDTTDGAKRVLTFTHGVTCDLTISGTAALKSYLVTDQLVDLTCDLGGQSGHKVAHGAALTITITPKAGCGLPAAKKDIRITMGGQDFADFTYEVGAASAQIVIAAGKITGDLTVAAEATVPLTSVAIRGAARVGDRLSADVRPSDATVSCQWTITPAEGSAQTVTGNTLVIPADAQGSTIELQVTGTGRYSGTLTSAAIGPVAPALANKAALRAAYDDGLSVVNNNYTAASWNAFQKALTDAGIVLDNGVANQTQVDDALAVLTAARAGLKTQGSTPSGPSTPSTPSGSGTSAGAQSVKTETRADGATVTTVTARDGSVTRTVEQPDGAKAETVTAKNGDKTITVTDAFGEEVAKVTLPAQPPKAATRFEDVPVGHWADAAIHSAAARKLVNGIGGNKYDMASPMTRGALATVLHRLSQGKSDYNLTFRDVAKGQYYTEGVAWAAKVDVVKGMSGDLFAPEATITREQLAVMLVRYAGLLGMDTTAHADRLWPFFDGKDTSDWAVNGVAWCVEKDILQGKGGEQLDPTATVSRAEVAVMLERFIGLIK